MSAKTFAACKFEPQARQKVGTGNPATDGITAELRFHEDIWLEYRGEAIKAGLSSAQASEYANALSPEMSLVSSVCRVAPVGRDWFYQSSTWLVGRTIKSGFLAQARWARRQVIGQTTTAAPASFAFAFRPWNKGGRS